MRSFIKEINKYEFILIYLCLLFFAGFYFFEHFTMPAFIIIIGILLLKRRLPSINISLLAILLILLIFLTLSEILSSNYYNNEDSVTKILFVSILCLTTAFLFTTVIEVDLFKKNYVSCMVVIAFVSVIATTIFTVAPSIIKAFPALINSNNRPGYFMIFTIVSDFTGIGAQRNQGVFWEPGAFQTFLAIAYVFELSELKKPRVWVLTSLLIAILTTYSTTGIIIGVLLLTYTLSRKKERISIIKAFVLVGILILAIVYILPRLTGYWEYAIVTKIQHIFDYQVGVNNNTSSRIDSIYYPLKEFINSPLWGIGESGYTKIAQEAGHTMFTATPVNLLVKHGLPYGVIVLFGIWKFIKSMFKTIFDSIIVFVILMLSISTEAFQNNIFILAMCFYGYSNIKAKKQEKSNQNLKIE